MRILSHTLASLLCFVFLSGCGKAADDGGDESASISKVPPGVPPEFPLDSTINLPDLQHGQIVTPNTLVLSASTTHISVDGVQVQPLLTGSDGRIQVPDGDLKGQLISALADKLETSAERAKKMGELTQQEDLGFNGRLLLQLDKSLPEDLVLQLMYTAGQVQYGDFSFLGKHPSTQQLLSTPFIQLPAISDLGKIEDIFSESQREALFGPQLSLSLEKNGFSLFSQGHAVADFGAESPKTRMTLPCERSCSDIDAYPWDELAKVLARFRSQFPADCTTPEVVSIDKDIQYPKPRKPAVDGMTRYEPNRSNFEHGFIPTTCVLNVHLDGRPDLPWAWWMRLNDELANRANFPHWVILGGTNKEEATPEPLIEGSVDVDIDAVEGEAEGVTSVVERYKGRIKLCYDQALREDPLLQGRIEIEFSVGGGRVSKAAVSTNGTGNEALAECILRKVKGLTFGSSVEADVIYPFVLSKRTTNNSAVSEIQATAAVLFGEEENESHSWFVPLCGNAECSSITMYEIHEDPSGSGQGFWGRPFSFKDHFLNLTGD
jgi:hypothetical protein